MRDQLLHLKQTPGISLQAQLREQLVAAILGGHIPPGAALPSGRKLAKQLGIARNTVVLAYQQLVDEGYLLSRERSGYYVSEDILQGRIVAPKPHRSSTPAVSPHRPNWEQRLLLRSTAQRNVSKPQNWQAFDYPFIVGQFDPERFPIPEWRECVRQSLAVQAIRRWAGDAIDHDDHLLIEQIHTRLLPRRGVWAAPEQILVTLGAQHALYILSELLMNPGTVVGMEQPGYPDARNIFATRDARLQPLPVDAQGICVNDDSAACDYIYCTPSHQYPTSVTLPRERRDRLLQQAAQHDFVIIEDDYEPETNFIDHPTPALKSLDRDDRVIYLGSLSKTLAPGLRIGYIVGPRDLIREARALRRLMLRHPPNNNQRAVAHFLAAGYHDALVRRLSHAFKERWHSLRRCAAEYLPDCEVIPSSGGTAIWLRGPQRLNAAKLQSLASDNGVLIEAGDVFFHTDPQPQNFFRLGFSSITVDKIEPGIRQLAKCLNSACRD